nr:MAG: Replication initiator protein A (RepA) N-terminus [Bacteriophage sp.]
MKYTLEGFSQEAALSMQATITEGGRTKTIKLDLVDLTILRWIVDFYPNMKKTIIEGTEYVWLDYSTFVEDMPLLALSNQSLYKRCMKMVRLGVLKHKTVRSKGTFSYYAFGPEYSRLVGAHNRAAQAPATTQATAQDPWGNTPNATPEQFQTPAYEPQPLLAEPEPKPQPKKTRKSKSFDDIIDSYTSDPETKELLGAWLQNRKAKRAAMTDRAIQGCIGKLDKCAQASHMSVNDYLDEVVCRGWSAFFPIENYRNNGYQQKPRQQSQQPHWDLTEEELRRQKEADDEWLKNCVF